MVHRVLYLVLYRVSSRSKSSVNTHTHLRSSCREPKMGRKKKKGSRPPRTTPTAACLCVERSRHAGVCLFVCVCVCVCLCVCVDVAAVGSDGWGLSMRAALLQERWPFIGGPPAAATARGVRPRRRHQRSPLNVGYLSTGRPFSHRFRRLYSAFFSIFLLFFLISTLHFLIRIIIIIITMTRR